MKEDIQTAEEIDFVCVCLLLVVVVVVVVVCVLKGEGGSPSKARKYVAENKRRKPSRLRLFF